MSKEVSKITISLYDGEFKYSIEREKSDHTLEEFMEEMVIPLLQSVYRPKTVEKYFKDE